MKSFLKIVGATLVALIIFFGIATSLSMCAFVGLASMSETKPVLTEHTIFRLNLNGSIVERSESDEMEQVRALMGDKLSNTIALSDVRVALARAAENKDKIDAIYLDCGMLGAAPASVEELRGMLLRFKQETGLPVIAYADQYSNASYWVASIADSIFLNPKGYVMIMGMNMNTIFMSKALDKLGVEMQVFKVGKFKSAVEPYILDRMSDANRIQLTKVTDGIWNAMTADIAASRNIPTDRLDKFVNDGGFLQSPDLAVELGLIDGVRYRKDVADMFDTVYSKKTHFMSLAKMKKVEAKSSYKANKIAVLYATGGIDDGSADGIDSEKIVRELNKLASNSKVKAVVLRVNSPGGSAFGSEQMWDAARRLREKKPLVVSMGDYAASGGYYMSCIADTIVTQPTTLTGSIGIFGILPNYEGLISKLGISFDGVKTHELSDFSNTTRPMSDSERALFQQYINQGYEDFVGRCAEGRGMTTDQIKAIAEGRVWLGVDALPLGLVDEMGGLDKAIAIAAEKANLTDNYSLAEYPKQKDFITTFMEQLSGDVKARAIKSRLGNDAYLYDWYQRLSGAAGMQALMPYYIQL